MPMMPVHAPIVNPVLSDAEFRTWKIGLAGSLVDQVAIDDAEHTGWRVGFDGQLANPPAHYSDAERAAFALGHADGFRAFEDDEADRAYAERDRLDDAFGSDLDDLAEPELIESLGSVELRRIARDWDRETEDYATQADIDHEDEDRRITAEIFADKARRHASRRKIGG